MSETRFFQKRRNVAERLVIRGELELTSPAHLGCGRDDEESDQPLITDQDGQPYLPGTSLAGLLRHQLDRKDAEKLFGPESQSDDELEQSRLLFSDCPVITIPATELREGVAINGTTGIAADKTKYDFELLPVGTKFALKFELLLPKEVERADKLKALTGKLLVRLEEGGILLGARSQRGFGDCRVTESQEAYWQVERYDFNDLDGLLAWMGAAQVRSEKLKSGRDWAREVVAEDSHFEVRLRLRVQGGILIGSGGHGADEADKSHLHRQKAGGTLEPILAGTSLAGVLRHRCEKILNTLHIPQDEFSVSELFGSIKERSKVRVWESPIANGQTLRHSRVRIDPWTGGAAETALYTQDVHYGGEVEIRLALRDGKPAERALLVLALRDLAEGALRVGGQSGAGRGRLAPAVDGDGPFGTIDFGPKSIKLMHRSGHVMLEQENENVLDSDFQALNSLAAQGGSK